MRSEPNRSTFFWKEIKLQDEFLKFEETVQIYIPSVSRKTLRLRKRHRQSQTQKRDTNRNWTKIFLDNLSSHLSVTFDIGEACGTYMMFAGSLRPFTQSPVSHFSFFLLSNFDFTCLKPAWVGRMSHHGASRWFARKKRNKRKCNPFTMKEDKDTPLW